MTLRMKLISIIITASAIPDQNRLVGVSVASVSAIRTTACPISASARALPKFLHVMPRYCRDVFWGASPPQLAVSGAAGSTATAGLSALPPGDRPVGSNVNMPGSPRLQRTGGDGHTSPADPQHQ